MQSSSRKGTRHALSSHLFDFRFSPHHRAFIALLTVQKEPSSFEQVDCDPLWCQAMSVERQALERNNTWQMLSLPPGHKPIGCRWYIKSSIILMGPLNDIKLVWSSRASLRLKV